MGLDLASLQQRLQAALRAEGEEFTVGPLLGQGGFAAVFRARDDALHRDVAVKVLDLEIAPSPTLAERFLREARTVAQLEHPHIVPIYKVGRQGTVLLYIVMRCIDGPSLRQLLGTHQRLSVGDAARITRQVADALACAHAQGIVHRDVKPDNILIDKKTGLVLVTDFGIAKAAQAAAAAPGGELLTVEGMIIGTPQYMSPEQAAGDVVDARSDIYSLGIVLYHMLAGAPPFDGTSSASIIAKQLTAAPEPVVRRRADVSPALAAILDRMLEKDPARRYQSAAEVSQALVDVLPTAARSRVKVKRSPVGTAVKYLVGSALVGCLVAVAFAAGAVAVAWSVFSSPARLSVTAPLPDSLAASLRRMGALERGDTASYVFQPSLDEPALLVLTPRRVSVAIAPPSPRGVRRYPRDSVVGFDEDLRWENGPRFSFWLKLAGGRADTVYRSLSVRPYLELARRLGMVKVEARP
jgi:serine/threonine protein kinase